MAQAGARGHGSSPRHPRAGELRRVDAGVRASSGRHPRARGLRRVDAGVRATHPGIRQRGAYMLEYLTLGEFAVALLMSLAALSAFIWASASGAFTGIEAAKEQVLRVEGICEPVDGSGGGGAP